jgi:hypothetical protein
MTTETDSARILSDDELDTVSGGTGRTNGDNPFVQVVKQAETFAYRQAKYFGHDNCP